MKKAHKAIIENIDFNFDKVALMYGYNFQVTFYNKSLKKLYTKCFQTLQQAQKGAEQEAEYIFNNCY